MPFKRSDIKKIINSRLQTSCTENNWIESSFHCENVYYLGLSIETRPTQWVKITPDLFVCAIYYRSIGIALPVNFLSIILTSNKNPNQNIDMYSNTKFSIYMYNGFHWFYVSQWEKYNDRKRKCQKCWNVICIYTF